MGLIIITNKGQAIESTNYWDSEQAKAGFAYLSWNAGAARLLVPDSMKHYLREMKTGKHVVVSRGPWPEQGRDDAIELMFEDGSESPFCLHMLTEQTDRLLPEDNQGGGFVVTVWTRGGEKLRLPGKYRVVESVPCMEEWKDH